jgi:hypothetical protein
VSRLTNGWLLQSCATTLGNTVIGIRPLATG